MNIEQAISNLKRAKCVPYKKETLEMAIKALEQEPCGDAISRQAVLNILFYKSDNNCEVRLNKELRDRIENLQPVTLQNKGHWEGVEYDGYANGCPVYDVWECTHCGYEHHGESDTLTDYCPGCGAKMEAESEETNADSN